MIPTTKNEWRDLEIKSLARVIAWSELDKDDQKLYRSEAKKNKSRYLEPLFPDIYAQKLAWNDLTEKEQKVYISKAQKKLSKKKSKE